MPYKNRQDKLDAQRRFMQNKKAWINTFKDVSCMDCSGKFPPECMDFDHRDPTKKDFQISRIWNRRKEIILKEIKKCDVVCANCHRIRTRKLKAPVV